jgi:hypothetical protein
MVNSKDIEVVEAVKKGESEEGVKSSIRSYLVLIRSLIYKIKK